MPQCPFCDDPTDFSDREMVQHMDQKHPEKIMTPEAYGNQIARVMGMQQKPQIMGLAIHLTEIAVRHRKKPAQVLEVYHQFLRDLMGQEEKH